LESISSGFRTENSHWGPGLGYRVDGLTSQSQSLTKAAADTPHHHPLLFLIDGFL